MKWTQLNCMRNLAHRSPGMKNIDRAHIRELNCVMELNLSKFSFKARGQSIVSVPIARVWQSYLNGCSHSVFVRAALRLMTRRNSSVGSNDILRRYVMTVTTLKWWKLYNKRRHATKIGPVFFGSRQYNMSINVILDNCMKRILHL